MRIVSLIPSGTEIVDALGYGDCLVGRPHECDYPARVTPLPVCTAPKFDPQGTGAEIDARVRDLLKDAVSVYRVDDERLRELAPDVVVTQTQCEICAVSEADVRACVSSWTDHSTALVSMGAEDIDGLWQDIECVSFAVGDLDGGQHLIARLKDRVADIAGSVYTLGVERPHVACLEWFDPLMVAGNWVPELVTMTGGENILSQAGAHSGTVEWDALGEADPDIILLMPCGFDLRRTIAETRRDLVGRPEWESLRAVQNGSVLATDGNHYFNRPGPRLVESLQILIEILGSSYPGHRLEGAAWTRFQSGISR